MDELRVAITQVLHESIRTSIDVALQDRLPALSELKTELLSGLSDLQTVLDERLPPPAPSTDSRSTRATSSSSQAAWSDGEDEEQEEGEEEPSVNAQLANMDARFTHLEEATSSILATLQQQHPALEAQVTRLGQTLAAVVDTLETKTDSKALFEELAKLRGTHALWTHDAMQAMEEAASTLERGLAQVQPEIHFEVANLTPVLTCLSELDGKIDALGESLARTSEETSARIARESELAKSADILGMQRDLQTHAVDLNSRMDEVREAVSTLDRRELAARQAESELLQQIKVTLSEEMAAEQTALKAHLEGGLSNVGEAIRGVRLECEQLGQVRATLSDTQTTIASVGNSVLRIEEQHQKFSSDIGSVAEAQTELAKQVESLQQVSTAQSDDSVATGISQLREEVALCQANVRSQVELSVQKAELASQDSLKEVVAARDTVLLQLAGLSQKAGFRDVPDERLERVPDRVAIAVRPLVQRLLDAEKEALAQSITQEVQSAKEELLAAMKAELRKAWQPLRTLSADDPSEASEATEVPLAAYVLLEELRHCKMDLVEEIRKKEKGHYEFTQILEAISRIDLPQPVVDLQPILAAIRNLNVHVDTSDMLEELRLHQGSYTKMSSELLQKLTDTHASLQYTSGTLVLQKINEISASLPALSQNIVSAMQSQPLARTSSQAHSQRQRLNMESLPSMRTRS
mmetsp:Transcript_27481/g.60473  ORF Transcript_27481/g.60473 Transcript_27481/m.60473 type:complete len:695 (+) Transcript_27481:1-2085(+)